MGLIHFTNDILRDSSNKELRGAIIRQGNLLNLFQDELHDLDERLTKLEEKHD